jgi:tetratricopeptide (TPR) repeat protein
MSFILEKEALIASGITQHDLIATYALKLDKLNKQFIREINCITDPFPTAKALFDWLWIKKPSRYALHGYFRLHQVIDSQLTRGMKAVGNCLGLTLLYACLLKRLRIDAQALYVENAFGMGPHVLTVLKMKESIIDIENILPDGFGYKGHLNDLSRVMWGDQELVADIYHSQGNGCYEQGDYKEALKNYDMAIKLNPQYERARFNKVIVLGRIGMKKNSLTSARKSKTKEVL